MLKFLLILVASHTVTADFKLNLTRTYFSLSPYSNSFLRGPEGVIKGSEDVTIKWVRLLKSDNQEDLKPEFKLDYHGKHPTKVTGIEPCNSYDARNVMNFALHFFNRLVTDNNRSSQCPTKKGTVKSPGHLNFERILTDSVYCNTPVTVTLWLKEQEENYIGGGETKKVQTEFFKAIFEGEFLNC